MYSWKIHGYARDFMFFFVSQKIVVKFPVDPMSRMDLEQWLGFIKGKKKVWELRVTEPWDFSRIEPEM